MGRLGLMGAWLAAAVPAAGQGDAELLRMAGEAGVAVAALIAFPVTFRYAYLLLRLIIDNTRAERQAAQETVRDVTAGYEAISAQMAASREQDRRDSEADRRAFGVLETAVTRGMDGLDALMGDVRELLRRMEPGMHAIEAIGRDIKARDARDAAQDAATAELARTLKGFIEEFGRLKMQVEEGVRHECFALQKSDDGGADRPADAGVAMRDGAGADARRG